MKVTYKDHRTILELCKEPRAHKELEGLVEDLYGKLRDLRVSGLLSFIEGKYLTTVDGIKALER